MSINFYNPLLSNNNDQKTNTYSSANATASATATPEYATASASASASTSDLSSQDSKGLLTGGFDQINNAIGNQEENQNGIAQMIKEIIQKILGSLLNKNSQKETDQTPQQKTQNQYPEAKLKPSINTNANPFEPNEKNNNSSATATASATAGANTNNDLLNTVSEKEREAVKGKDLGAVDKNGYPMYLIAKGFDGKNHIYEQSKFGKGRSYKAVTKVAAGSNMLNIKDPEKNKAAASSNNSSSMAASFSYAHNDQTGETSFAAALAASSGGGIIENKGGGNTHSPLILDTNKDGKVSAQQGKGVDINGDGKADGAATGGDKMLAMSDLDGDGQITGKEVFGDKTVDPFTGKELNAKNGFEALQKVAQSAEKHTGIKCTDENGEVDLQKLKQAMEQSGKGSLGMISDNNNTKLEGLGDASKINTSNYINQKESGDVQHNQLGGYKTTSGEQHRVDDVWFKMS